MTSQQSKATDFRALHIAGQPLVLFNIWDAGSARAVAKAGARAIATGSWSVAAANGFDDGEHLPLDVAIQNLERIVAATNLPVTIDVESGYADVAETIRRTIAAGAIGCNLEDSLPSTRDLHAIADQAERIQAARAAADAFRLPYFINARTDVFLNAPPSRHDDAAIEHALQRARAYAAAGANGIFVPGLIDAVAIARFAKASPLPVNVMIGEGSPSVDALASAGVARVSHGPGPYVSTMKALEESARAAHAQAERRATA